MYVYVWVSVSLVVIFLFYSSKLPAMSYICINIWYNIDYICRYRFRYKFIIIFLYISLNKDIDWWSINQPKKCILMYLIEKNAIVWNIFIKIKQKYWFDFELFFFSFLWVDRNENLNRCIIVQGRTGRGEVAKRNIAQKKRSFGF